MVTGSRAEYGLLRPLMRSIEDHPALKLQVVVTGGHLAASKGLTIDEIELDGFRVDRRVDALLDSDSQVAVAKTFGLTVMGVAEAYRDLRPDIVVLLGDRYEILASAVAAMLTRLPIAHIHGGELTEGLIDESIRHCITKLSHLHFAAADAYRNRVIQLGESPDRVWTTGALAIDAVAALNWLSREELEDSIGVKLRDRNLLVTYSPVTLNHSVTSVEVGQLVHALRTFSDYGVFITLPNADLDEGLVKRAFVDLAEEAPDRVRLFANLGQRRYLSLMRQADVVVGNSSSGLLEAPLVGTPTVNIGDRQRGRLHGDSVIDCDGEVESICAAIRVALGKKEVLGLLGRDYPYGTGSPIGKIVKVLATSDLDGILSKKFFDLGSLE